MIPRLSRISSPDTRSLGCRRIKPERPARPAILPSATWAAWAPGRSWPRPATSTEAEIKHRQQTWRRAHPHIVRLWHALDRAAKTAVGEPGKVVPCRDVALKNCPDGFLRMRLPNGRKIAYPFPKLKADKCSNTSVVFMDNQKGRWGENRNGQGAYGGTWVEKSGPGDRPRSLHRSHAAARSCGLWHRPARAR